MKNKHYIPVSKVEKPDEKAISQQEKILQLYKLAKKINVTIGDGHGEDKRH